MTDYTADRPGFREAKWSMYRAERAKFTAAEWAAQGDAYLTSLGGVRVPGTDRWTVKLKLPAKVIS